MDQLLWQGSRCQTALRVVFWSQHTAGMCMQELRQQGQYLQDQCLQLRTPRYVAGMIRAGCWPDTHKRC